MNYVLYPLSGIGLLSTALFLLGVWLDFQEFDPTRGVYEPPYEGVIGEPIDWFSADRTPTGLARRGRAVNTLVNGTTGMISFRDLRSEIPFRTLSERALVVHRPREAFIELGFDPQF